MKTKVLIRSNPYGGEQINYNLLIVLKCIFQLNEKKVLSYSSVDLEQYLDIILSSIFDPTAQVQYKTPWLKSSIRPDSSGRM